MVAAVVVLGGLVVPPQQTTAALSLVDLFRPITQRMGIAAPLLPVSGLLTLAVQVSTVLVAAAAVAAEGVELQPDLADPPRQVVLVYLVAGMGV